jgi:6-phosphofructokinase 1
MNAAIRSVIRAGLYNGLEMYVVYDGLKGLVEGNIRQVNKDFTQDIINRGGTIIRSSRLPEFEEIEVQKKAAQRLSDYDIDALVGIGGDGTFRGLRDLSKQGVKVMGIPGSIDNDVASSDYTIGFMTALNTICDCIDKIKDTSSSHQKCSIIEVMGRHCGDLAMYSSLAEAAELTLTAYQPLDEEHIFKRLRKMKAQKKSHAIVVVSENLLDVRELGKKIQAETGFDTNVEVLGHLQRGGAPCAFDRILASRMGSKAIQELLDGKENEVIVSKQDEIIAVDIDEALAQEKPKHDDFIKLVKMLQ